MKTIILLFGLTFVAQQSYAQSFIEICPATTTTGTIVNFEEFNGELYGTGFFDQICGTPTDYLTKWNGTNWEATTVSLPNEGHSISAIGSYMYFSCYVNTVDSNWVYQSDGTTIAPFGNGFYLTTATSFSNLPTIYDVVEYNGDIIVCGEFNRSGLDTITGIARWNGNEWEPISGGLSGNIAGAPPIMYPHQMLVHNNELYIVGNFRYAGGVEVNGVAKWDGSAWSALGDGFNSTVYGIGTYNNEIWAVGDFTMSGTETLNRMAKWNGTSWESPGFGFINTSPTDYTFVHTFYEDDGGLYMAGGLKRILMNNGTEIDCGGIIHYSPSGINTFNGGVSGNDVEAIGKTSANQLIIGGGVFGNGKSWLLDNTSSQNELTSESQITVSPNPVTDIVAIETDLKILEIKVLDINGVQHFKTTDYHSIDISSFLPGVYILQIKTSQGIETVKILK